MRFALALLLCSTFTINAFAQGPAPQPGAPAWPYPQITTVPQPTPPLPVPDQPPGTVYVPASPAGPIPTGVPERYVPIEEVTPAVAPGQQHWVSLNFGVFQPFVSRVGVKAWSRPNNSVWVEGFFGSALFHWMYGFGVRVQHTAWTFRGGDQIMVSPGFGVHILPEWRAEDRTSRYDPYGGSYYDYYSYRNALYYLYGDVDISFLHDFSPHFGFELGVKLGLAGRVAGTVGRDYPSGIMFGQDLYPLASLYCGFRF